MIFWRGCDCLPKLEKHWLRCLRLFQNSVAADVSRRKSKTNQRGLTSATTDLKEAHLKNDFLDLGNLLAEENS